MTNSGSRRTTPLPKNWPSIRRMVLVRDRHRCLWGSVPADLAVPGQCSRPATDVDHIIDPEDHHPDNLRSLCGEHHDIRTSRMAGRVSAAERRRIIALRNRPQRPHPGMREDNG
jgi:5-methylcytosine-specific restriction enzyme A